MKFKVKSCWYGFSHHTLWSSDESQWVNVGNEGVRLELHPICDGEIRFNNGKLFCSSEKFKYKNDKECDFIESCVLWINNFKGEYNEEWIELNSNITYKEYYEKEDKYIKDDFYELQFFHPLYEYEFSIIKNSIINGSGPSEVHISFESNKWKTFSYDYENKIVNWDVSIEDERIHPGSVWFKWGRN